MRYFCFPNRPDAVNGDGEMWVELDGERAVRQVDRIEDHWHNSSADDGDWDGLGLADQPFDEDVMPFGHEIEAAEFERVWSDSVRRLRRQARRRRWQARATSLRALLRRQRSPGHE